MACRFQNVTSKSLIYRTVNVCNVYIYVRAVRKSHTVEFTIRFTPAKCEYENSQQILSYLENKWKTITSDK